LTTVRAGYKVKVISREFIATSQTLVVVLPDPFRGMRSWRNCKKNTSSAACIGKRTREGCNRSSEVWTADEMGKGQFFRGNRRYLAVKEL